MKITSVLSIFLFTGFASVQAQDSYYVADFSTADFSGVDTRAGGTFAVTYSLASGAAVTNIGQSFQMNYTLSALSGPADWEWDAFTTPLGVANRLIVGLDGKLGAGLSGGGTMTTSAVPVAGPGWVYNSDAIFLGTTRTTNPALYSLNASPTSSGGQTHGSARTLQWDVLQGTGSGETRGFFSTRDTHFADGFTVGDKNDSTYVAFTQVPEPSAGLLALASAGLLGLRRRR